MNKLNCDYSCNPPCFLDGQNINNKNKIEKYSDSVLHFYNTSSIIQNLQKTENGYVNVR